MNSDDLSKEQLAKLSDGLTPGRNYLRAVLNRLQQLDIPDSDPLSQRVIVAIDSEKLLNNYIHFLMGDPKPPKDR